MRSYSLFLSFIICSFCCFLASEVFAQYAPESAEAIAKDKEIPQVTIGNTYKHSNLDGDLIKFKNGVEEEKIFTGKKVSVIDTKDTPEIPTNNYREVFSRTPGLLVSEVTNESFASINYRGLGDPHEAFNINVMEDEIPLNVDPYGYPAAYFMPPMDFVDSIEFTRGGGALLYGSQPGGALNFITRKPSLNSEFDLRTKHVVGSKNLYSTYNEVGGTKNGVSYLLAYHHRQSDGFRVRNSDYALDFGSIKVGGKVSDNTTVMFQQDIYDSAFGEAGGLTLERGQDLANFFDDRWQTSLNFDTLSVGRYVTSAQIQHVVDNTSSLNAKAWYGYITRNSKRQSYGTAPTFGGIANGSTNTIQLQEFNTFGFMTRYSKDWSLQEDIDSTFSTGIRLYAVDSPFTQQKGATPDAEVGSLERQINRDTYTAAVYAENKFTFGKFSIVPGVRLEQINQSINETFNVAGTDLRNGDNNNFVSLFGLGSSYVLTAKSELYANFSQSFKPVTYQDTLPLGPTDQVNGDINEAELNSAEFGVRGNLLSYLTFDTSLFYTEFSNQFGRVGQVITNTGKGRYFGVDVSSELSVSSLIDRTFETSITSDVGLLSLYGNASILNAEFTGGTLDGNTPQYAPDYLIRSGVQYEPLEQARIKLATTIVASHFADDGNTGNRFIPSYKVWDLIGDIRVCDSLSINAGINNLFDATYYSRIRSNGIDPALPRNIYAGFTLYY